MTENNPGSDFISRLVELTISDKLIWENHNWKGRDFDIAYCSPWMLCLDDGNSHQHPLLRVARSYHCFVELAGVEYGLGPLLLAVASQNFRVRCNPDNLPPKIEEGKIKKFLRDKTLRDKREKMFSGKILKTCQQSLNVSTADFVSGT